MVGTTITVLTWCSAIRRRQSSASKRSASTTVARSAVLSCRPASPQVWNSGAGISMVSSICIGMRESNAAMDPKPFGCGLRAPFGVPLVPEVSTMSRPG